MIHCSILLHHPAPGNPTHLSRHWVRWVALNIEQSPHFDIRRRLQACHPLHPSPPYTLFSTSLFRWLTHKQSAPSHIGSYCSLSFHQIVQKAWYLGWRKWVETKKGERRRVPRKKKKTTIRIMACAVEGLLTKALMEKSSFFANYKKMISGASHSKSTYFQLSSIVQFIV